MPKLLVLTCGTNACYHFCKTIKEKFNGSFFLIGADINPSHLVPTQAYIDKYYRVPFTSSPDYYQTVLSICKRETINYILPSFDADQFLFYPENQDLINIGVKSLSTPAATLEYYKNKKTAFQLLDRMGISIPRTYNLDEIDKSEYYFIKPIDGVGSIGARMLTGEEIKKTPNIDHFIIQEICTSPEITLECFFWNGNLYSAARERLQVKEGVCTKAKIYHDVELEKVANKLARTVELPAFFNLQFMKNGKGEYCITDVNLRLAGGMGLTYAAGWDVVSSIARIMLGETESNIGESLVLNKPVQYGVRAYENIITNQEKNIIGIDYDGTILDSRNRHKNAMSIALKCMNMQLDLGDYIYSKTCGKSNIDYLRDKGIDGEKILSINKAWIEIIENEDLLREDFLYSDTISFLEKYKSAADFILVSSRSKKESANRQFLSLGIADYFKECFFVDAGTEAASQKAKILVENNVTAMIGDTEVDQAAAMLAGILFFPVANGFRNKNYWENKKIICFSDLSKVGEKLWGY